jgi:hypothetical protein
MKEQRVSRTLARTPEAERYRYAWMPVSDAAKLIGGKKPVSRTHVVRLIEAGLLKARNVGIPGGKRREWRVDPASIEAYLDKSEYEAA